MPDSAPAAVDPVDPDIRRFVSEMSAGYARHPAFDRISKAEARAIAEAVRSPWREGGPEMAETRELMVPTPQGAVRVRLHRPAGADGRSPALVYLHGGGWTLFSLDTHDRLIREYAARAGVVAVGVDYALSPEARFPVALNQVVAVVRWLQGRGAEVVGADPERLAVGGDSAGGNLTVGACLALRDAGEAEAVKAMLLNYAVVDREVSEEAGRLWGGDRFMLGHDEMEIFWRDYLASPEDGRDPLACPIRAELQGMPAACLTIAECDVLADQNRAFARRLAEAGVPVTARVYQGATHSFLEAMSISTLARQALQDGADWLRARLLAA